MSSLSEKIQVKLSFEEAFTAKFEYRLRFDVPRFTAVSNKLASSLGDTPVAPLMRTYFWGDGQYTTDQLLVTKSGVYVTFELKPVDLPENQFIGV